MNATMTRSGANWLLLATGTPCAQAGEIKKFMYPPRRQSPLRPCHAPCERMRPAGRTPGNGRLCHSVSRRPARQIGGGKGARPPLGDCPAKRSHQAQVEGKIVQGVQAAAQDLVASVQMPQVRPGVVAARIAVTFRVDWTQVRLMDAVADVDDARLGEEMAVAGMACRHDAIEHVDAA